MTRGKLPVFDREYFDRRMNDPEAIAQAPDNSAPNTMVYRPTPSQVATFGDQRVLTCGSCRHFQHKHGQLEMEQQDFLNVLVHEYEWKKEHLCDDPKDMALCGLRDGTLVGPNTKACDQYNDRKATIIPVDAVRRKPR